MFQKDDLEAIIDQTDVEALVYEYGIEKGRSASTSYGSAIRGCCPFPDHDDNNPSFIIHTDGDKKGRFVCTPDCGYGSFFDFISRMEGVDFKNSIKFLKGKLPGGTVDSSFNAAKLLKKLNGIVNDLSNKKVNPPVIPHCERNHKMIAWYMNWKRGIGYKEALKVIEADGLMWCNDDRRYFLESTNYGMTFKDSIIIPLLDCDGNMVSWQAQFVDGRISKDKLYACGAPINTAIPGLSKCIAGGYRWALVVEGYWDCVKAWHYGYPAVSTLSAWVSDDQINAMYVNLDKIVTAFDNDDAGRVAARRVQDKIGKRLEVRHLNVPHKNVLGRKLDVDDMTELELEGYIDKSVASFS